MFTIRNRPLLAGVFALMAATPQAHAVMPVVDVRAIVQMVQQLRTLQDQLATARNQLTQAQTQFNSMTGGRGMERLLNGVPRNYLPSNWLELDSALRNASSSYNALAASVRSIKESNAVLTPVQLAALSERGRSLVESGRQSAAMMQAMGRDSLKNTSDRFALIQQLTDAIPRATDQKAILDLHARIATEQIHVTNDATKVQVLYQIAQAEELARQQRSREQAMADVGSLRTLPPMGLMAGLERRGL